MGNFTKKVRLHAVWIPAFAGMTEKNWTTQLVQQLQHFAQSLHRHERDIDVVFLRHVRRRQSDAFEAELRGFANALLTARHGAYFAREPDLSEHDQVLAKRTIA